MIPDVVLGGQGLEEGDAEGQTGLRVDEPHKQCTSWWVDVGVLLDPGMSSTGADEYGFDPSGVVT